MRAAGWMIYFWVDIFGLGQAPAVLSLPNTVPRYNRMMAGTLLDFTNNHGCDRRIWSPSLCQKRDLYVYLPPNFDPRKRYPLIIHLHGAAQDEQFFRQTLVLGLDKAISCGQLPPVIVAAPDGSLWGRPSILKPATFFANSRAGRFEDYIMKDVWNFMMTNFPILPEREAHALMGASMGGSAAFALGMKHRDRVKVIVGLHPLVNLRYVDCRGHYRSDFRPDCWGLRQEFNGMEALGKRKLFTLRFGRLFRTMYGNDEEAIAGMSRINPLEIMLRTNLKPGELDMFIGYGGKDEFNVAAQVESFLFVAKQRNIPITVHYEPNGRHNLATSKEIMPHLLRWAARRVPPARPIEAIHAPEPPAGIRLQKR